MGSNLNFRNVNLRSPIVLTAIGVITTLVLAVAVVMALLLTGGSKALSDNAALIGAVVALGGVFTTQLVNGALDDRRNQEAALQNYFERVGKVLTEKSLYEDGTNKNLGTVVRAQTLAVLEGLVPHRKRILLQFLYESVLKQKDKPVVSLAAANLSEANLSGADLRTADLRKARMSEAILYEADMSGAILTRTKMSKAKLSKVGLSKAFLIRTDLSEANLSGADLSEANLTGATLSKVRLNRADLSGANLSGANGVTTEQLEQQAASLEGAIMPDGSIYP
jgi:uncharacterized protein YjbI with pentapeptide repeats